VGISVSYTREILKEDYYMKKIALALIIACGMASVSASIPAPQTPQKEMTLDERIRSLSLTREKARGLLATMAEHKVLTAFVLMALAGIAWDYKNDWQGSSVAKQQLNDSAKDIKETFNHLMENLQKGYQATEGARTYAKNNVLPVAGVTALIATIVYAAYDLNKEEDKSEIRKLFQKCSKTKKQVSSAVCQSITEAIIA
jgi:hypothetical protein